MNENTKLVLDKLQELNNNSWSIKTSKGQFNAKSLNFKQQKELISTIADGTIGGLKIQKIINNIIIENVSPDLDVTDKLSIIVFLRSKSIGPEYITDGVTVPLTPIYEKLSNLKYPDPIIIDKYNVKIELFQPSLALENKIIQATIEALRKDKEDLGKNVQDIYTYEIIKYVKSISFDDNVLNFEDLSLSDKYKIIDNIPITINNEITQYIQKCRQLEKDILSYEKDGNVVYFDIDASFFDS